MISFIIDKCFGLLDIGQRGLKEKEERDLLSAFIPTITGPQYSLGELMLLSTSYQIS